MSEIVELLTEGQGAAEERMSDRCDITRSSAQSDDLDPDTGLPTAGAVTDLFADQPCRLRREAIGSQVTAGGDVSQVQRTVLSVPLSVVLKVGDAVTMTSSLNPLNVGLRLVISALPVSSQVTALRYEVEVITG